MTTLSRFIYLGRTTVATCVRHGFRSPPRRTRWPGCCTGRKSDRSLRGELVWSRNFVEKSWTWDGQSAGMGRWPFGSGSRPNESQRHSPLSPGPDFPPCPGSPNDAAVQGLTSLGFRRWGRKVSRLVRTAGRSVVGASGRSGRDLQSGGRPGGGPGSRGLPADVAVHLQGSAGRLAPFPEAVVGRGGAA